MTAADATAPPQTIRHPTLWEATQVWARIGFLSFGGPAGQIALMHRELVEERRWISESRFLHALNFCMLLPGPEAQQLATYVGWLLHGTRGGVIAGTLFVIPGFLIIVALSVAYGLFQGTGWLASVFFGLKAAVVVIVVEALIRVGRRAIRTGASLGVAAVAFVALFFFAVPFPLVVLGAGLFGLVAARLRPDWLRATGHGNGAADGLSVVGQDFPEPVTSAWGQVRTLVLWCLLWLAPLALATLLLGPRTVYASLWVFFSQMAVVTFGGAYAVLAYVAQEAVGNFGWLRPGEMIDGLALAETTPGPLVLVLSFVGFLAALRDPAGLDPLWGGLVGATLTAWVTFVPCFLWILLGAPYVERLRANAALSGALAAITAAVVGVILNLAVWFGLHVLFRSINSFTAGPLRVSMPDFASLDLPMLVLVGLAALLLMGFRIGVVRTLLLVGAAGCALAAAMPGMSLR